MSKQDFESRYQVTVRVALLTCAISFDVITVRDVLYQIDVAKSVMATPRQFQMFELQGVQIHRLVQRYGELGWITFPKDKKGGRKKFAFNITPEGIFGLIESLMDINVILSVPETVFAQWFLKTYQDMLIFQMKSSAAKKNIKYLYEMIQNQSLIHKQIALLNEEIAEVKQKMRGSQAMQAKINHHLANGDDFLTAAKKLDSSYSYGQANQRPYADLIASLPEDLRIIEINRALPSRERHLYRFNLLHLEKTQEFYRTLLQADLASSSLKE